MKTKLLILLVTILFAFAGYSQTITDSVRTRNDKPGTPQSLRTTDQSPQSHVTISNTNAGTNQNVNHTSSEGSNANNTNGKTTITTTNKSRTGVPKTPVTLQSTPVNPTDTIRKTPLNNKVSNASNPLRN